MSLVAKRHPGEILRQCEFGAGRAAGPRRSWKVWTASRRVQPPISHCPRMSMQELEGSVAIVTGSARNIGPSHRARSRRRRRGGHRAHARDMASGSGRSRDRKSHGGGRSRSRRTSPSRGLHSGSLTKRSRHSAPRHPGQQCGSATGRPVRDHEFGVLDEVLACPRWRVPLLSGGSAAPGAKRQRRYQSISAD